MQIGQFLRVHQSIDLLNASSAQGQTEDPGQLALFPEQEGRLAGVLSLSLSAGGIQEIYALVNPEKLAYLNRQLAERGITPETSQPTGFSPDQR